MGEQGGIVQSAKRPAGRRTGEAAQDNIIPPNPQAGRGPSMHADDKTLSQHASRPRSVLDPNPPPGKLLDNGHLAHALPLVLQAARLGAGQARGRPNTLRHSAGISLCSRIGLSVLGRGGGRRGGPPDVRRFGEVPDCVPSTRKPERGGRLQEHESLCAIHSQSRLGMQSFFCMRSVVSLPCRQTPSFQANPFSLLETHHSHRPLGQLAPELHAIQPALRVS